MTNLKQAQQPRNLAILLIISTVVDMLYFKRCLSWREISSWRINLNESHWQANIYNISTFFQFLFNWVTFLGYPRLGLFPKSKLQVTVGARCPSCRPTKCHMDIWDHVWLPSSDLQKDCFLYLTRFSQILVKNCDFFTK